MTAASPSWSPRWPPLEPEFVVVHGAAAVALARALCGAPSRLEVLRGVVVGRLLALTGAELPWVDGAEYYGRDGTSPWLLVPTHRAPSVPCAWLERRYRAALPQVRWPCLLLSAGPLGPGERLLPVGGAASVDAARLERWCHGG